MMSILTVRNNAIWILGELRDEHALPVLAGLVTGQPCDHQFDVCQHELHKAIGKINARRELVLWRWVRNAMTPCTRAAES